MTKKIICFDLDNTIFKTHKNHYKNSKPIMKNLKLINSLYDDGYYIKIFTSRYMGRAKENKKKAERMGFDSTKKQLKYWGLKYNELIFGKPSFHLIVDDKALFFKKNWTEEIKKKLKKIK